MRYRIAQYAEALHAALKDKKASQQRVIARQFAQVLMRHRMIGKANLILAAYEKLALQKQGMRKVRIESASPVSEQLKKEIGKILGAKINFEEVESHDLLAGIKIFVDDELLIDASARRQVDIMLKQSRD